MISGIASPKCWTIAVRLRYAMDGHNNILRCINIGIEVCSFMGIYLSTHFYVSVVTIGGLACVCARWGDPRRRVEV